MRAIAASAVACALLAAGGHAADEGGGGAQAVIEHDRRAALAAAPPASAAAPPAPAPAPTTTRRAGGDARAVEHGPRAAPAAAPPVVRTDTSAATTTAACPAATHLMDSFTREPFPSTLGSCALVGSGGALRGGGAGGRINMHDTVIRVNRVPTESYYADLGSKTTVFYSNSATDTYPSGQTGVWITKIQPGNKVGSKLWCQFQRPNAVQGSCPFDRLVVARSTKFGSDRILEKSKPFRIPEHHQPPFSVSHPSLALETFYWNSAPMEGYYTSGGLKAFFTIAPMCESITLYGFVGSGNLDNHTIDGVHNFELEHQWLQRMAVGDVNAADFRVVGAEDWLRKNGLDGKVMGEVPPVVEALKDRLKCMGERGKIIIDGWTPTASMGLWDLRGGPRLGQSHADTVVSGSSAFPVPDLAWSTVGATFMLALLAAVVLGRRRLLQAFEPAVFQGDTEGPSGPLL